MFEGSQFGGALMTTTEVENFPGFPEGIQGPQLMDDMRTQAERFGAELRRRATSPRSTSPPTPKIVKVGDEVHRAHAVIVATGSKYRYLGLENEAAPARPRRLGLCHLRRLLLPRPGHRRGRRW